MPTSNLAPWLALFALLWSSILQAPGSAVPRTAFLPIETIGYSGGSPSASCGANSPNGVRNGAWGASGPPGLAFAGGATGVINCYVPLDSWDGTTPFSIGLYSWVNSQAPDNGTVSWQVASGCSLFNGTLAPWTSAFNPAQPSGAYNSASGFVYARVGIPSLTMTGCTKGVGQVLTLAISRAAGGSKDSQVLALLSVTGIF